MTECYNFVCGLPLAGISLVGALAFPAFMFLSSKSDNERLDWLAATTAGSLLFLALMLLGA